MNLNINQPLSGRYRSDKPNQEIILSREQVKIEYECNVLEKDSTVAIRFHPGRRLEIELSDITNIDSLTLWSASAIKITFPHRNITTQASITVLGPTHVVALPTNFALATQSSCSISRVLFHVMNFHDFIAPTDLIVTDRQKSQRVGRALVEFDDWQVVLDTVQNISDLTPSLRYTSGYAITHVGCLARRGEKPFSSDEAEDILTAFHVFLSFCRGFWVDPTLPIGIDVNGETCWEDWRVREQDPWESRISWFDEHHGELLGEVFPGFWRLWKTPSWRDAIRIAVYWYIRSNNSRTGTDGAIILTQAGLEQLAWSFLVQNENALSMDGFEKLSAADQIRLLLTALKIPRTIPSELNQLSSLAKEHNWDGPAAFTEMRNSLVHPRKMQRTKSKLDGERLPITDAWSLGLWYFELALLSLFGHTGVYAERYRLPRSIGEVGNVPWATPH